MLPIKFENGEFTLTETADTVPVFRKLKQSIKNKKDVNKYFEFLYRRCAVESPYRDYEKDEANLKCWKVTFGNENVNITKELQDAIDEWREIDGKGNPHLRSYDVCVEALDFLARQMRKVTEVDDKGMLKTDEDEIKKIVTLQTMLRATVKEMSAISESVEALKKKAETKHFEKKKTTKDREIGLYED